MMTRRNSLRRSLIVGLLANFFLSAVVVSAGHQQHLASSSINAPFTHQSFSKLDHAPCVSLFTRNGRVGCGTADRSVEVGRLVYYQNVDVAVADDNNDGSVVIVVEDYAWTAETIASIQQKVGAANLAGILVLNATSSDGDDTTHNNDAIRPSPDARTPQGYGTVSAPLNYGDISHEWNLYGENLLEVNLYGLPIAYVPDADVSSAIRTEAKQQQKAANDDRNNAVVAEFNYYMGPAEINSFECLAWKDADGGAWVPKCLPLAGTSVWASLQNVDNTENNNQQLPTLLIAAGMDATSYFHDVSPGANTAASNILTILWAAKLVGRYCNDDCRAKMTSMNVVFALFQAETYGFVGSRSFLRDVAYPGFTCPNVVATNPAAAAQAQKDGKSSSLSEDGCLNPVRQSLRFAKLGPIAGMLAVDQVGHSVSNGMLYSHAAAAANNNNNNNYGSTLATLLKAVGTDQVSVSPSSTADNGNGFPYPPSPLTSLLNLSGGAVDGAVLTGFDYVYTSTIPYHSHWDVPTHVDLDTVVAAATIVARTAVAAAVGGDDNAAAYAVDLIPALTDNDDNDEFQELAHCFLYDGNCKLLRRYSTVELANNRARTGFSQLSSGLGMTTPPNYYVGVYNVGQPFVQVGEKQYGSYDGADYGKAKTDAIVLQPRQMEAAIRGLLNEYLGQHDNGAAAEAAATTTTTNNNNNKSSKKSCSSAVDCTGWLDDICPGSGATCTGAGRCVCQRAHYHVALDEGLRPAVNEPPGYFSPSDENQNTNAGTTPVYTEPFWSSAVGVRVYRQSGPWPGIITLIAGGAVASASFFSAVVLKMGLKKEKLF